jgi:hypothetical protein
MHYKKDKKCLIYLVGLGLVAVDAVTPRLLVDPTNAAFV